MDTNNKLKIEVWSDVVCPFCYIGKKHLEDALETFEHKDEVEIEWKSYQLDPTFEQPAKKLSIDEMLAKKYNKPVDAIRESQKNLVRSAKEVGLDFDFDSAVPFNTFQAHRVIQKAKEKGLGDRAEEIFFSNYFEQGKDLGKLDVLKKEAIESVGLSEADFSDAISNKVYADKVLDNLKEAYSIGVQGVPFFVFDRKYAVSGAQPVPAFVETLQATYDEWKAKNNTTFKTVAQGSSCDVNGNCD